MCVCITASNMSENQVSVWVAVVTFYCGSTGSRCDHGGKVPCTNHPDTVCKSGTEGMV